MHCNGSPGVEKEGYFEQPGTRSECKIVAKCKCTDVGQLDCLVVRWRPADPVDPQDVLTHSLL